MKKYFYFGLPLFIFFSVEVYAQKIQTFSLGQLLKENKIITFDVVPLNDGDKQGVSCSNGVFYLKDVNFSRGTIDVDLRGKDTCFLGIAFHGIDTATYESVYFRPFNFQSADSLRKHHALQYVSYPEYPWERLRKEEPLVYEKATPSLLPGQWFHVRIDIKDDWITVFVNHATEASLKIKSLSSHKNGLLGLWEFGEKNGDFANLIIKTDGK
jgi:hypothetical protein